MRKIAICALALSGTLAACAVPGTVRTATDSKTGDVKWQARAKSYNVSFKRGGSVVSADYPLAEVEELSIEKPANYDKLVELVSSGQGQAAVQGLSEIVKGYRMLQWDKPAGRWLVQAYLAAGQAQEAYKAASGIIGEDKSAAYSGDLAPAYWQVLLKLGKRDQLENCLNRAASAGDRATSAEALLVRGDILVADGDGSNDAYRKALTDAYLRVALMYNDPPCREAQRSAMLRCADAFDKLGMAARAEGMRTAARSL